ncbi:hypothetical protein KIN20_020944 [Parelaphostrongylus tenuis]|uniref:Uncharacterized protein n=1 Tax=Parelaphostrongylus tenuis TaxID=148309 RepID=A0AAD5NAC7_PARTN|nr:hypothetical protein KIN20_020944 [Parelaphostrongylus tenuis]
MAYTDMAMVSAQVPGIATSKGGAQAFVHRLVMKTVFDVLENQARSSLLPDAVISTIFGQLSVTITYEPLQCQKITNIIMANWSKTMWQGVMNRAVRMLASGPFRSHFFSAVTTVGGN